MKFVYVQNRKIQFISKLSGDLTHPFRIERPPIRFMRRMRANSEDMGTKKFRESIWLAGKICVPCLRTIIHSPHFIRSNRSNVLHAVLHRRFILPWHPALARSVYAGLVKIRIAWNTMAGQVMARDVGVQLAWSSWLRPFVQWLRSAKGEHSYVDFLVCWLVGSGVVNHVLSEAIFGFG